MAYADVKIRVLLADDHAIMRDGLRLLLAGQDDIQVVDAVADGREAVRLCSELAPDLIIMDIGMPKLNGIEATHRIHRTHPHIKIIMLSMHATKEHIHRAMRAGASGYLLKESAGWDVVDAVRTVMTGRRYLSRNINAAELDNLLAKSSLSSPLESLSRREREILQLVVEGRSSAEIADLIALSPKTVDSYRSRLMQKLAVKDVPALVKFAIQFGVTQIR